MTNYFPLNFSVFQFVQLQWNMIVNAFVKWRGKVEEASLIIRIYIGLGA